MATFLDCALIFLAFGSVCHHEAFSQVKTSIVSSVSMQSKAVVTANVRVNSNREYPPRENPRAYPVHLKKKSNARPCGQFLLANARLPVPSLVVKCPAL